MNNQFFDNPILNSPYTYPNRHWELDGDGQPTQKIIEHRRRAEFISAFPKSRKRGTKAEQYSLVYDEGEGLSTREQQYAQHAEIINSVRREVDDWRRRPEPSRWRVTPETARLIQHWRHHQFSELRPFFCQVEAAETVIWLTEVAPNRAERGGRRFIRYLEDANQEANPGLLRLALKLATGAGKTTVMAMLIAWQTINAARRPQSSRFTRGFLIVTPGLTIKDRLRVLQPNDPDSYYRSRELVPSDLLPELDRAKIVITNYHALRRRERVEIAKGGRSLLQGRGPPLDTRESEGQMLKRLMPELMGMKNILVLNDEAHHCYRERQGEKLEGELKGDEKKEAEKNREAARLWISGIEAVRRRLGTSRVIDLSATPFFLSGSGYAEGTLFPWTMCDFSLMDAIECGIVKLPRVPVADNVPGNEMPMYRELWKHIRTRMPRHGRRKGGALNPSDLPPQLRTALDALYGHYEETFRLWEQEGLSVPPCFIVVCNNTATSKLVYDYISGFYREREDGSRVVENGRLALFRNFDLDGRPLARPRTLLIDSEQLESGEALDVNFRKAAGVEIERFRREIVERTGDRRQAEKLSDEALLREVMNTVGKRGRLGDSIRCVVSVSMLSEGWDANTVTHVLGVRAFGTQLLCEQVVGRALRRQSYDLNGEDRFNVEYADVLGIPFDFTATPVIAPPKPPRETIHVHAVRPERDHLEIRFPRVAGYGVELPGDHLSAEFTEDSVLVLTPDLVGATETKNSGIIGESVDLTLAHTGAVRPARVAYELTAYLLLSKYRDADGEPRLHLFGQLKRIVREWLAGHLVCKGGTNVSHLSYKTIADMACERIAGGITRSRLARKNPVKVILDPYNPTGSTAHVNFRTSKTSRYQTDPRRCHINWAILDSDWEAELCRVVETHPQVVTYVKNHNLGLEVPYRAGSQLRHYLPDFVVLLDDGIGDHDFLHLIVEVKGYRGEDAKDKKTTMETLWVPGVNRLGTYGRWAFAEFRDVYTMPEGFELRSSLHNEFEHVSSEFLKEARGEAARSLILAGGSMPDLEYIPRRKSEMRN
jgi:type III restriction enzyme